MASKFSKKIVDFSFYIKGIVLRFSPLIIILITLVSTFSYSKDLCAMNELYNQFDTGDKILKFSQYERENYRNLAQKSDDTESQSTGPIKKIFDNIFGNTGGPLKGINKTLNKRFDWGYDRGFFLESRDGNYRVKMNIWGQLQFAITDSDEQDFDFEWKIRRLRIALNGHIIRPWLDYVLQFSADNQFEAGTAGREGFEGFKLRDLYLNFAYNTKLVPRIGRYKVPFTRDQLMSGRDLLLVERSIVNTEFTWGRDSGLAMYGQLGDIITYGASVTSGSGLKKINFSELDFSSDLYTGRIQYNPCCGKLRFGGGAFPNGGDYALDPSFGRRDVPIIEIGASTLAFPNLNIDQKTPDNNVANRFEELGITQGDVYSITTDIAFTYKRYSFEAEYVGRWINPDESGLGSVYDQGFSVDGGIFLISTFIQLAGRVAYVDYDDVEDVEPSSRDNSFEITSGLNLYFSLDQRWKFQLSYSFIKDEFKDNTKNDQNIIKAQLQFNF